MISGKNKLIALLLGIGLSIFSWIIFFINVVFKIATLSQIGVFSIDTVGFFFTSVLLSIYTIVILFKVTSFSWFPLLLILLHLITLNGSTLAIFFVIIDLIILVLLNSPTKKVNNNQQYEYYSSSFTTNKNHQVTDENVFDAEYSTKDE